MRGKIFKILSLALTLAMVITAFTACSNKPENGETTDPAAASTKDILIGVLCPTSGSETQYGTDMYNSYKLAVKEINDAGGVLGRKLALYQADDANDANIASQAAAKIIAQNPDFVVGGYGSSATIPALQQFYDENLVMLISAANSTKITELNLNQSFMVNSPGTHAVTKLTELCKSLDVKKVALIHQGDAYTKNLSDLCTASLPNDGFAIATTQVMEKGQQDVSAIVTAVRNSGADFVYWCGYHADGSNVIKQLRSGGYTGNIAVGDGSASVGLIEACGTAGEGVYVTSPPFVEFAEGGSKFIADYKAMFNIEPGNYATLCYDTIYLLKKAIEQVGSTDFAKVRDAVQNIEYKGLSGTIKFTANRELKDSNFIILEIKNGKFELVKIEK